MFHSLLRSGVLAALLSLATAAASTAETAPNVVILLADDLGWADVGYHGSDIETPNIDSLAAEGVQLDRLYVPPICSPTRAALMTGRDPMRLGVAWFPIMPWSNKAVSPRERFMPEDFQAAGYQTGMVGKWHLGHTLEITTPNARGFDDFFGHLNTAVDYYEHFAQAGGYDLQHNGTSIQRPGRYLTDVHGEEAARFIRERDPKKPFFLYVPFLAPHSPHQAPKALIAKYAHREDPIQRVYAAMVDSLDRAVGTILRALEEEGLEKNTIVLFLSDNGGPVQSGAQNTPLQGGKMNTFEGGLRVVGVLRWPAKLAGGATSQQRISAIDLYPTLISAAGLRLGNERALDGRDQWKPLVTGKTVLREQDFFFAAESPTRTPAFTAVISGRFKLVQQIDQTQTSMRVTNRLFDIEADPSETKDLAAEQPGVVKDLAARISVWRSEHPFSGTHVQIVPHPGWRSPKDWATAVLPAEATRVEMSDVFPQQERVLDLLNEAYGDLGKVSID